MKKLKEIIKTGLIGMEKAYGQKAHFMQLLELL